jgi:SCP-2 sterol transfer family
VDPELTITVDGAELLLLATRRSSPLQAYLSGNLRASGNPMLAARLTMLFGGRGSAPPA